MNGWNAFEHSAQNNSPEKSKGWARATMVDSTDVHVYPQDDDREHAFSSACICCPEVENDRDGDGLVVKRWIVHNAWDGRPGPNEQ